MTALLRHELRYESVLIMNYNENVLIKTRAGVKGFTEGTSKA